MRSNPHHLGRVLILLFLLGAMAVAQTDVTKLESGKPVERELKGGESQAYSLNLSVNQFIRVKTDQKGIDVVVTLFDPEGKQIVVIDSPNGTKGEEPLWFVAAAAGQYRIEIASLEKDALTGKYEITLLESRPAAAADQDATGKFLGNQARSLFNRDSQKARKLAMRALELGERSGSKKLISNELELIGNTYAMEGDLIKALEHHQRSLSIRKELNDMHGISNTSNNLGIVYSMLGNVDKSLESFNESFESMLKEDRKGDAAVCLYNIATVYRGRGDFARAMAYLQRSSVLFQESGEPPVPADLALNFAGVYQAQGDYEQAIAYNEKARRAFEASRSNYGLYQALDGLGETYFQMGDYAKAIEHLQQALAIEERMRSRPDIVDTLRKIGDANFRLGDYNSADQYYQRALKVAEDQTGRPVNVSLRIAIARLRLAQGKTAEAVSFAEQAKASFDAMIGGGSNFELYDILGQAYFAAGSLDKARQMFQLAVVNVESEWERSIGGDEEHAHFFNDRITPYRSLIKLLRLQGLNNEAFKFSEQSKSRTIIGALQTARIDISRALTPTEKSRERKLKNDLVSLNTQISKAHEQAGMTDDALRKLEEALKKKRLEFEDFRTRTDAAHPELQIQRGEMKPITAGEAGGLLATEKSALLEYAVAENKVYLFVLTRDGKQSPVSLKAYSIDNKEKELAGKVESFRSKLAKGDLDFQKPGRELYDLLLKPAEAQLAGKTNLIIVPDGPLWNLPFQALQDGQNQYLIEKAAVSYAPSFTALKEMSKKARSRKASQGAELLAFGNPSVGKETADRIKPVFMDETLEPLPEAERLVNSLAKIYGADRSKVFTGPNAREDTAKAEAPKYRIVQFATHGILNNVSPMYSHLVLARQDKNREEDGLLEAWEMKDLDLKADMVILSACDTARGKVSSGEGVIGMSWALFIAGTPTTVASQWKVESSSTTELMLEFHRNLRSRMQNPGAQISKARALQLASLKLLKSREYRHPFYWAGFVMIGNGY